MIIDNCIFLNNNVEIIVSGEALGGAIYCHGTNENYVNLNITNSKFINNSADTDGGAINCKFGTAIINNCLFEKNFVKRDGGAIGTRGLSNMIINNCKFLNNHANEWGGAINNWLASYTINTCEFKNNSAGSEGGAISNCGSLTQITKSKFINNTAIYEGGAIHSHYDAFNITLLASENEFINNFANIGHSVYLRQYTTGVFNFENNYWGSNEPNWTEEFEVNNVCDTPSTWLQLADTTILANNTIRGYNSPYDFSAIFLDKFGRTLTKGNITFKINKQEYNVSCDSNGVGKLVLKLPVGDYKIIIYNPDSNSTLTKTASIVKRITENKDLNIDYLNGIYKIHIIGDDGNYIKSDEIVTFKIGNKITRFAFKLIVYKVYKLRQSL